MCKALITVSMCTFGSKRCQSTWRWGFSEEFCMKGSHTLRSVCCASTCAFFISMWKLWRWAYYLKETRSAEKPVSSFSLVFFPLYFSFLLPLFSLSPLRFTRPSHTSSKGLPDTPLSEALSPTAPLTCHSVHVCVKAHIWAFEISHFLPTLPPQRKESGGGKTKRELESGVDRRGRLSDCCSPTQRGRKSQSTEFWPAASYSHHTAFVRRVDLERTFQRRREKSGRWQKNTETGQWEDVRARGEGAEEEEK